ncbi:Thaumatin-like protein 1 [Glycine soja]|uniref:Thaumatin-like protein 1 n=1 Tax=Glycine soja TaxID=3848 RepID=A0A0B2NX13_GLYSO|nr:Thaumatin-like protein 1 [Glycine soja]
MSPYHGHSSQRFFIFLLILAFRGVRVTATTFTFVNKCDHTELRVDGGDACQSACRAFGKPEFCCSDAFNSPAACAPSMYSQIFKAACPKSYSYAYDDATSTFTCTAADYTVTFCPSSSPSLKSLMESGPGSSVEQAAVATTSWIANLATGDSTRSRSQPFSASNSAFFVAVTFIISYLVS